jgi:hypothetical protein
MSMQIMLQGTVQADGTLELDDPVATPEGRVQVTILPIPDPAVARPRRSILDVLDEIHAAQAARGYGGRSIEELEADEAEQRAEDDESVMRRVEPGVAAMSIANRETE